jgi:hypothetical protein
MSSTNPNEQTTQNAVKLVGEALLPGASLLMDGKILQGGAHFLVGAAARALLGPVGWVLVAVNSYSTSTTGKGLLNQFSRGGQPQPQSQPQPQAQPVTPGTPGVTYTKG